MEDVADENQHERDRIEIPGLDKDRGHHQPTNPLPFRVVVRDQIADGAIHRCLMRVRGQHSVSFMRAFHSLGRRSFPSSHYYIVNMSLSLALALIQSMSFQYEKPLLGQSGSRLA